MVHAWIAAPRASIGRLTAAAAAVLVAGLALLGGQVGEATAATSQLVFTPTADTYVSAAAPWTSFGTAADLRVRSGTSAYTTYLRFSVTGVTGAVTSARLRLNVRDATPDGGTLHPVASTSWSESITWRTAPAPSATPIARVGPTTIGSWADVDLGGAVTGNGAYSFAIRGVNLDTGAYTSRQGTARPQLVLTVSTGPSAPVNTVPPAVSGGALEAQTLTATPGSWTADPVPAYAYQWRRCDAAGAACVEIPGAAASTYQAVYGDVGRTLRVRVTATNSAGSASAESGPTAVVQATSLSFPIRAGFYYGWYPENWVPGMNFTPSLGLYDSGDPAVISKHIASMQYAGMRAGIYSWWGLQSTGNSTTSRFPLYLDAADGTGFKWAAYYEPEGYGNPTAAELQSDLTTIRDRYASSPNYLRVAGRPVVFVYSGAGDGCDMAARWKAANSVGAYVVLSNPWVDNSPQLAAVAPYATKPGIRVASGDLTGDGKAEIVTAPSAGTTTIGVFTGAGTQLASFVAGDPSQTPGAFVAVGDVTGDGRAEIVVASGATSAPWIRVYSYAAGMVSEVRSFNPGITTGVRIAVGDVTGDGVGDIVAASGPGAVPVVKVFGPDGSVATSFAPYDTTFTRGLYVAAADVTGDARAEIVLGGANGSRNEVRVVDRAGTSLVTPFAAYTGFGGAVAVAVGDVNGDGGPDIVTGASGGPHVRAFTLRLGQPSGLVSFFSEAAASTGQVWVAAADAAGEGTADIVTGSPAGQSGQAKVFGNVRDCASQPDGWHEYLVTASGESAFGGDSFTVAPGYWWADAATPALARDPDRWGANVGRMAASGADWQLVLSFNEWGEATSVESATAWPSASGHGLYVDTLRAGGATTAFRTTAAAPSSLPPRALSLRGPRPPDTRVNQPRAGKREKPTAPAAAFPLGHRGTVGPDGRQPRGLGR